MDSNSIKMNLKDLEYFFTSVFSRIMLSMFARSLRFVWWLTDGQQSSWYYFWAVCKIFVQCRKHFVTRILFNTIFCRVVTKFSELLTLISCTLGAAVIIVSTFLINSKSHLVISADNCFHRLYSQTLSSLCVLVLFFSKMFLSFKRIYYFLICSCQDKWIKNAFNQQ